MSESQEQSARNKMPRVGIGNVPDAAAPTTRQLRTVGQRRRDAELKLEQHLREARHRDEPHGGAPESS